MAKRKALSSYVILLFFIFVFIIIIIIIIIIILIIIIYYYIYYFIFIYFHPPPAHYHTAAPSTFSISILLQTKHLNDERVEDSQLLTETNRHPNTTDQIIILATNRHARRCLSSIIFGRLVYSALYRYMLRFHQWGRMRYFGLIGI